MVTSQIGKPKWSYVTKSTKTGFGLGISVRTWSKRDVSPYKIMQRTLLWWLAVHHEPKHQNFNSHSYNRVQQSDSVTHGWNNGESDKMEGKPLKWCSWKKMTYQNNAELKETAHSFEINGVEHHNEQTPVGVVHQIDGTQNCITSYNASTTNLKS